jgi:menaquinone-dependent protoporphyrinogen IX oxidase
MSMSQEEIEALMSGADDIEVDETEESAPETEKSAPETEESTPETEESTPEEEVTIEDSTPVKDAEKEKVPEDTEVNVDDILAGIDGIVDDEKEDDSTEEENEDDILSGIDGITDDSKKNNSAEYEKMVKDSEEMEAKIDSSQYPLPASDENKVVNQLNEVADDSEEKATQIFDVLSFILDENAEIDKYNKSMSEFIEKQSELLTSLSIKFPNVNIFNENLNSSKELLEVSKNLTSKVNAENNKVFEAMELMQYHDINRQKIERVMSVIKKLSSYLNGIFEDDSGKDEVQVAKHISGDSNDIVDSDDIDSLISEFSKEK